MVRLQVIRLSLILMAWLAPTVQAQTQIPTPAEAITLFELADEFGEDIDVKPVEGAGAFPWWVMDHAGQVLAVIQKITVETEGRAEYMILHAQLVDGNDLKIARQLH
jgi:hypothetical protein